MSRTYQYGHFALLFLSMATLRETVQKLTGSIDLVTSEVFDAKNYPVMNALLDEATTGVKFA